MGIQRRIREKDLPVLIDRPLTEKDSSNARRRKKYGAKKDTKKTSVKVKRTIQKGASGVFQ